jgi:hypothetical protein
MISEYASGYGNPGISSAGGDGSEGGVIGFGDDEGGVIGFGDDEGGVIGFGVAGGVEVVGVGVVVVVMFFIDFGRPHIFDSVVLTKASFGLLGSHTFDFIAGEIVVLVGDGLVGGGGVGDGEVGDGEVGDGDDGAEGVWA